MHVDLLREVIAACKPEHPLDPDDPRKVDVDAPPLRLRGSPLHEQLAAVIRCSSEPRAQLVTGVRGSGKTTALLQLQKVLREANYHVVMVDAGEWLSSERPIETEDLMLALLLALYPDGEPSGTRTWKREHATRAHAFLRAEAKLEGDIEGVRLQLTTDERLFERVARRLRERDGVRRRIHGLLGDAAEAARNDGHELVIVLDGAEKRALGQLHERERRAEFHDRWLEAFTSRGHDLKPPVHIVYTVPAFMIHRATELAASFGSELHFLPMVRVYDRESQLDVVGVEAMTQALLERVPEQHFADEVTPRWLAAQSAGHFRDLLRFVTEMVYQVGDAPRFTRAHAEAAVTRTRQIDHDALVREDKEVLAWVHRHKALSDRESTRLRTASLLYGGKVFRYDDDQAWYDAHPLCWSTLGFAADLPSWDQLAAIRG